MPNSQRKTKKTRSARMRIGSCLPEDMVREILLRLPVQSLLRFQTVCKQWLALITSSNFIDTHFQHRPKQSIMLSRGSSSYMNYSMSLLSDGKSRLENRKVSPSMINRNSTDYACIVGSANGLVCVRGISSIYNGDSVISYILWNPATRVHRHLPSPVSKRFDDIFGYKCASGFAFHPETKDYKLLMVDDSSPKCLKAEVFSLRTSSWKQVNQTNPLGGCVHEGSVVVKGIWYHIAFPKDQTTLKNQRVLPILKFDMVSDAFSKMEVELPYDDIGNKNISLMTYKEVLAMSAYWDEASTWRLDIWTMKNECWTKLFMCRPFPESITTLGYEHYEDFKLRPLGIWNDKEIILFEYSWSLHPYQLHLYDPLTKKSNVVIRHQQHEFHAAAHTYVESLVSVYGTSGMQGAADGDGRERKTEVI